MSKRVRQLAVVILSTVGSRVLGLVRDMVVFAMLGAGLMSSAFLLAFTLPNLFRRLLGEGALTSALVPSLAGRLEHGGKDAFLALLAAVIGRVGAALLGITFVTCALLLALPGLVELPPRWELGAGLGVVLFPYLVLVCLAAVLGAALNTLGRFGVHALSQVWLNAAQILALGVGGALFATTDEGRVGWLCAGVLVGGLLQLLAPWAGLRREGWSGRPAWRAEGLSEVWTLLVPGLAGAAVMQVNVAVTRVLAFGVSEDAVALLYLANRLVELPLGIFVIAVTTVRFPELARLVKRGDDAGAGHVYADGMREVWTITLPAAAGLVLLAEPILAVLFARGQFGAESVAATAGPLAIYALGLPLYGTATFATRALHAYGDTATPSRVAAWVFAANVVLSLALMGPLGVEGLAAANVATTALQAWWLRRALVRRCPAAAASGLWRLVSRLGLAAAVMVGLVVAGHRAIGLLGLAGGLADLVAVVVLVPGGAASYFGLLWALGGEERRHLREILVGLRR